MLLQILSTYQQFNEPVKNFTNGKVLDHFLRFFGFLDIGRRGHPSPTSAATAANSLIWF